MKCDAPAEWPRVVRPRKPLTDTRPIIALDDDWLFIERTRTILPSAELPLTLLREPPSLLICERASGVLAALNHTDLATLPGWQYRVAPVVRRIYTPHRRKRPTEVHDVTVAFLGWRFIEPKGNGRKERVTGTHYHYPLDPNVFSNQPIRRLVTIDEQESRVIALLQWGIDVRNWCRKNGIRVSSSAGGLAVALLKDPRFYPERRRKVPRATNDKARPHLPGNHYELFVPERRTFDGLYVDMTSAHHFCAAQIHFPSANSLLARGGFRVSDADLSRPPRFRVHSPAFRRLIVSHGLLALRVTVPRITADKFPPPYLKEPGRRIIHVYSNELSMVRELGCVIEGVEAAWTSFERDDGLSRFALWALTEIDDMSDTTKRWAKSALLATYGMLAARPDAKTFGYRDAKSGADELWMTPGGLLPVKVKTQERESEPPVANVIHRGMIEADVRLRALTLARTLHKQKIRTLCIYADSVIIAPPDNGQLPFLPFPWRIKTELNRLQFFNPTSFVSEQVTRLPGIPAEDQRRMSQRLMIAALTGQRNRLRRAEISRDRR